LIDWEVNAATLGPLPLLDIDDETITSNRADPHRWNAGIMGAIQYLLGQLGLHRKDDAGLTLPEQQSIPPQCLER